MGPHPVTGRIIETHADVAEGVAHLTAICPRMAIYDEDDDLSAETGGAPDNDRGRDPGLWARVNFSTVRDGP